MSRYRVASVLLVVAALIAPRVVRAQAFLIEDLNTIEAGPENADQFWTLGPITLFTAGREYDGYELWRTDGTPEGTTVLRDIHPGPVSSDPELLLQVGSTLYFQAEDHRGSALWRTDGTSEGTVRVVGDVRPSDMADVGGGVLVFTNSVFGDPYRQVWRTDGNEQGTFRLPSGRPDPISWDGFVTANGMAYFAAFDEIAGLELWKTDGSVAGTARVADIRPGIGDSDPRDLVAMNGILYFWADDGTSGRALWRSDGTTGGTWQVEDGDVRPGGGLAVLGDVVLFIGSDVISGLDVWRTDGTEAGTFPLTASLDLPDVWFSEQDVGVIGDEYVFAIEVAGVPELWKTDGTVLGTQRVAGIPSVHSWLLVETATQLFMLFDGSSWQLRELWRTDGTEAGTAPLRELQLQVYESAAALGDIAIFGADAHPIIPAALEPWRSDGTPGGTFPLGGLASSTANADPKILGVIGDVILFVAADDTYWRSIFRSDGTAAGTELIWPSAGSGLRQEPAIVWNGNLYFLAMTSVIQIELWRSDGTAAGTRLVKNVMPRGITPRTLQLLEYQGLLHLVAHETAHGTAVALWRSDGTEAGTQIVAQLGDDASVLGELGGALVYENADGIWKTDLTSDPVLIESFDPNVAITGTTQVGSRIFIATRDTENEVCQLWSIDGAAIDATLLGTFPSETVEAITEMTSAGATLFFVAPHPDHGVELWQSDGTPAGTVIVAEPSPGPASSDPREIVAVGSTIFFVAFSGSLERIWRSDGTLAGTMAIGAPPFGNLDFPVELDAIETEPGKALLVARRNNEERVYGVTQDHLVFETLPPIGAYTIPLAVADDLVFLSSSARATGTELWALPTSALSFCGDGTVDPGRGELCDDGNRDEGDSCDAICAPEPSAAAIGAVAIAMAALRRRSLRRSS